MSSNTEITEKSELISTEKSNEAEGSTNGANKFANDGSFMAMFLKMQQSDANTPNSTTKSDTLPTTSSTNIDRKLKPVTNVPQTGTNVLKRRKPLKVGVIKKTRNEDEEEEAPKDAWSKYMSEVKKYKEKYGDDSDKNRPLVK